MLSRVPAVGLLVAAHGAKTHGKGHKASGHFALPFSSACAREVFQLSADGFTVDNSLLDQRHRKYFSEVRLRCLCDFVWLVDQGELAPSAKTTNGGGSRFVANASADQARCDWRDGR
jgi:hypothetical protein